MVFQYERQISESKPHSDVFIQKSGRRWWNEIWWGFRWGCYVHLCIPVVQLFMMGSKLSAEMRRTAGDAEKASNCVDSQSCSLEPKMFWILRLFHGCHQTQTRLLRLFIEQCLVTACPQLVYRDHSNDFVLQQQKKKPFNQLPSLFQHSASIHYAENCIF